MNILPWHDMLGSAAAMGLRPAQFWEVSVAEWRALAGINPAMTKQDLHALQHAFPDQQELDYERNE
ncbi:phage tail assembly chaperone [Candidatus Phycosocius spiralis]|uniref:Phage tail assembly chaperone n=1 Tax=Candidatus Phycosocius spiralis TaxID=2815099 RepID=A0ABQ4PY71_9PROT|nr:phage tail assembly chaperone [Candidatus Phycosocius spiralis]GIU67614.1 hypothetical protein PsB1_1768 [Candidatus Phycosocius spiralis]